MVLGPADQKIGLWQPFGQGQLVPGWQAPGHRELGPGFSEIGQLQDGLNRLLDRGPDEGASVDQKEIGFLGGLGRGEAKAAQKTQKPFAVDQVFGAAQGD
jgi:hypothetical protein